MANRFWSTEMTVDKICIIFVALQSIKSAPEEVSFINSKTSQSKSETNHDASLAIDNKRETCSIAEQDPETKEQPWWRVQTKSVYNIENMIIHFTTNHFDTEYNITNDLSVFVSADVHQPYKQLCYSFETSQDYVRFKCKRAIYGNVVTIKSSPESNGKLILCEVKINHDMSAVNIALRRPIKANFIEAANSSAFLLDGDNGTCISIANNTGYSTININLDYSYYVTNVNMYFQSDSTFKGSSTYNGLNVYVSNKTYFFDTHMCGYSKYFYNRIEKEGFLGIRCNAIGKYILIENKGSDTSLCEIEILSNEESLVLQGGTILQVTLVNFKTSQNQMNSTFKSHLAIDGNTESCLITESNSEKHPWWRMELDRVHFVVELSLYLTSRSSYSYFMNNFQIYISSNASNYEEHLCYSYEGSSKAIISGRFITLKCKNVTAGKFVTIYRVGGVKRNTLILCEVRLGADRKTVNLALGKPTSHNGMLSRMNSEYAVDSSLTTCAVIVARSETIAWWRVVLDDSYYITDVNVFYTKNDTSLQNYSINVFISNDNNNFEDRTCGSPSYTDAEVGHYFHIMCKVPILGNYVTIKKQGKKAQNWLVLCEVEIFSKEDRREISKERSKECLSHEYQCIAGGCIHDEWLCDGTDDCPYGDDEPPLCHTKCGKGKFKCLKRNKCIREESRCNSYYDCVDYSDENACFDPFSDFLRVTYMGEPNYYVCSKNWETEYSSDVCQQYNSLVLETQYLPLGHATPNVLTVDSKLSIQLPPFSYLSRDKCDTNKYVKIRCSNETNDLCGSRGKILPSEDFGRYIIGGDNARAAAWPWHVQIFSNGNYICGGSIIDAMWILTSADCFRENSLETNIYVKVGTVVLNDRNEQKRSISFVTTHPEYRRGTNHNVNDIALVRLKLPLPFTNFVRPICLPTKRLNMRDLMKYRHCVISGFGRYDREIKSNAKYLQQGRMNIMDSLDCAMELARQTGSSTGREMEYLRMITENNFICGGSIPSKNGIYFCKGDSGSALVCKDHNNIWTQVGLAKSITYKNVNNLICSTVNLFTRIDSYLSFIIDAREARDRNYE